MFKLSANEARDLIFQSGISKPQGRGGRRHRPYAFTEQGVAMLSSVLNSERAVAVNIEIMRAFVRLRELLATNADLPTFRTLAEQFLGISGGGCAWLVLGGSWQGSCGEIVRRLPS